VETDPATKPSVLFIYYTYTLETLRLVEAMADVLRGRGCEANLGAIAFIDPRYADRFKEFPVPHPFREVVGMIPAELRRRQDPHPRRRDRTGVRPRVHRLSHLVAVHQGADPLLPAVGHGGPGPRKVSASPPPSPAAATGGTT
jgi:hypothetical protein